MNDDGLINRDIRRRWAIQHCMGSKNVVAVGRVQVLPDPPHAVDLAVVKVESRVAVGEEHVATGVTADGEVATKVDALLANEGRVARIVIISDVVCLRGGTKVVSGRHLSTTE